jgi:predicted nucleotidyltransferase
MLKHSGLKSKVINEIIELAQEHGLKRVILFGSRARGDFKQRSDIDLAISGGEVVKFSLDIDDKVNTLLLFDIVNMDDPVQEELLSVIEGEGVLIYEKI